MFIQLCLQDNNQQPLNCSPRQLRPSTKKQRIKSTVSTPGWSTTGTSRPTPPQKFNISRVAMIPHKFRTFTAILDLSFHLRHKGKLLESVNAAMVQQAPAEAMIQLGTCTKCLVATLADNYDPNKPFYFAKLDIKDGFWQMAVAADDAGHFCYSLPSTKQGTTLEDTDIVVPNSLQMGWCKSPPFFCAASETARDIIAALLNEVSLQLTGSKLTCCTRPQQLPCPASMPPQHTSTSWRCL